MSTLHVHSQQEEELLSLHDEVMEKYLETLKRWASELPPDELPAMVSTYNLAAPESVSGYKALITTVLIDEVTEQRIAGVLELVNQVLRGAGSERA